MPDPRPLVSVILIVYNDEANVVAAARSALTQSYGKIELIIVDDGSDDGTSALVDRLGDEDDRVNVLHLSPNSGGCSTPRNAGIDAARGDWVMFLDSDDLLERNACEVLLGAALRHDADIAGGSIVRIDVDRGTERKRFAWLYRTEAVFDGLRDRPEFLSDVMVQNRIFRRALLVDNAIRFPADVHFEDMDFTARALARARRIAVVPDVVYRYLQRSPVTRPSITQRNDIRSFEDRIAVHRLMDEFLLSEDLPQAKLVKDVKFLQHDLRAHMQDIDRRDPAFQSTVVEMARAYIDEVDPEAIRHLRPAQRLLVAIVRRGDVASVVRAVAVRRRISAIVRPGLESIPAGLVERLSAPYRIGRLLTGR